MMKGHAKGTPRRRARGLVGDGPFPHTAGKSEESEEAAEQRRVKETMDDLLGFEQREASYDQVRGWTHTHVHVYVYLPVCLGGRRGVSCVVCLACMASGVRWMDALPSF